MRHSTLTKQAMSATAHCLTGCAIGETLGMVIGTAAGWPDLPTVVLSVALAFFFGYALTVRPVLRSGLNLRAAIRVALAADTISITVMEIVDNAVMLAIPGAMGEGVANWKFWAALAFSLAVAFVITVPVNRWLIGRGKGHAVMHEYHGHDEHGGYDHDVHNHEHDEHGGEHHGHHTGSPGQQH